MCDVRFSMLTQLKGFKYSRQCYKPIHPNRLRGGSHMVRSTGTPDPDEYEDVVSDGEEVTSDVEDFDEELPGRGGWAYFGIGGHPFLRICFIGFTGERPFTKDTFLKYCKKGGEKLINCQNPDDGYTPLHVAVDAAHFDVVEALVSAGCNINTESRKGESPLMKALRHKSHDIARLLILTGADVNAVDSRGMTARKIAQANRTKAPDDLIDLIVSREADEQFAPRRSGFRPAKRNRLSHINAGERNGAPPDEPIDIEMIGLSDGNQSQPIQLSSLSGSSSDLSTSTSSSGETSSSDGAHKDNQKNHENQAVPKRVELSLSDESDVEVTQKRSAYQNHQSKPNPFLMNNGKGGGYSGASGNRRKSRSPTLNGRMPTQNQKRSREIINGSNSATCRRTSLQKRTGKDAVGRINGVRKRKVQTDMHEFLVDDDVLEYDDGEMRPENYGPRHPLDVVGFHDRSNIHHRSRPHGTENLNGNEVGTWEPHDGSLPSQQLASQPMRVKVEVEGERLLIPCPDDSYTVRWLMKQAEERYSRQVGKKPVLKKLVTKDGAMLDLEDKVSAALQSGQDVVASVDFWEDVQAVDAYKSVCKARGELPLTRVLARLEQVGNTATAQTLNISGLSLRSSSAKSIFCALADMRKVVELDLENNCLDDRCSSDLTSALESMPNLTSLNLRSNALTQESIGSVLEKLGSPARRIRSIDFSYNFLGRKPGSGTKFCDAARIFFSENVRTLEVVRLSRCGLGDCADIVEELASWLRRPESLCRELSIARNHLDEKCWRALCSGLHGCRSIRTLNIASTNMDDVMALVLAESGVVSFTQASIDISGNCIERDGSIAIGSGIAKSRISEVVAQSSFNSAIGFTNWISSLEESNIRILDVSANPSPDPKAIAHFITASTTLTRLVLKGCRLSMGAAIAILEAVPNCVTLQDLDMSHNEVGLMQIGLTGNQNHMYTLLHRVTLLRSMDLSFNHFAAETAQTIAQIWSNASLHSVFQGGQVLRYNTV